ncbi:MAG TPA: HAD family hydrolase [Candidatus Acidoferrum sp.]|nr:HAD family hydrolase [Candidatus Acidoferrum sp.]
MKSPSVIIFDVDGVLVDVRGSFQKTTLETVKFFTGKRVTRTELHRWKNLSGYNDDWKLSTAWVRALGGEFEYEEVKRKFVELYWGKNRGGNVRSERWMLPRAGLQALARKSELAIFTGRTREELDYTLNRNEVRDFFARIVTVEDVKLPKPDPEGLLKILGGRTATDALYIGDNIDDALAAQGAQVPFVGVLPRRGEERPERERRLLELGAKAILHSINELRAWLDRKAGQRGSRTFFPSKP